MGMRTMLGRRGGDTRYTRRWRVTSYWYVNHAGEKRSRHTIHHAEDGG